MTKLLLFGFLGVGAYLFIQEPFNWVAVGVVIAAYLAACLGD